MKKILAMLIAMLLCVTAVFGLASCGDDDDGDVTPPPVVVTVEDAIEQINVLYGRDAKETSETYDLMGIVKVNTTEFTVDWTLECEDETVTIAKTEVFVKNENGEDTTTVDYRYYTVTVPHVAKDATIAYTITATITKDDVTKTATFERTVVHGHVYADATCQVLATCDCGETTGELAACVDADENFKCDVCGEVVEHDHVYADATCTTPKTCLCGATEGEKLPCVDEDKNYICDECEASILTGAGTDDDAYVLPYLGAGVCAFPGGFNSVWYSYTATEDGYVTVSSTFASAWLKIGTTLNAAERNSNGGNGQAVKCLVKAGDTVIIGIADWDEKACDVDFAIATESVELKDTAFLAGNWSGTETALWGKQNYVFYINADGTGNGYYIDKTWDETKNFDITSIYYIGDEIIINIITTGEYGGEISTITFAYAEEEGNKTLTTDCGIIGVELILVTFEDEPIFVEDEIIPDEPASGAGSSSDPYVIPSIPFHIEYTEKFDVYYSYTADKDITIVLTYTDGVTVNDLPSNAVKDMAAKTWTFSLTAGQTVKMNIWTQRASGDFQATLREFVPTTPEEPEQPEGGETPGEPTGVLVYISEAVNGRSVMFEIDAANGTMVVTRANMSGTFDGTVGTNYTYSYDPATKTVICTPEGYTGFLNLTFDENGAPVSATYAGINYINYTLQ